MHRCGVRPTQAHTPSRDWTRPQRVCKLCRVGAWCLVVVVVAAGVCRTQNPGLLLIACLSPTTPPLHFTPTHSATHPPIRSTGNAATSRPSSSCFQARGCRRRPSLGQATIPTPSPGSHHGWRPHQRVHRMRPGGRGRAVPRVQQGQHPALPLRKSTLRVVGGLCLPIPITHPFHLNIHSVSPRAAPWRTA